MRIPSRLKKLEEKQCKIRDSEGVWDLSKVPTDQLIKLKGLLDSGKDSEAAELTKRLVDEGLATYELHT